jgi:hypothetical protein
MQTDSFLSQEELEEIEARCNTASPGPWFAHATDDEYFMNARYVSLEPGEFRHDNKRGMGYGGADQVDPDKVIAITLLQQPELVYQDKCNENTIFIANARADVPRLLDHIRYLEQALIEARNKGIDTVPTVEGSNFMIES